LAIGDSDNDISMLEVAGHSYAPANAIDLAKAAANHIVAHHEADAVAEAVEHAWNLN
jgi:hydroxymethylpyrimidine pyrophosphatase-like HAD family hydrolase